MNKLKRVRIKITRFYQNKIYNIKILSQYFIINIENNFKFNIIFFIIFYSIISFDVFFENNFFFIIDSVINNPSINNIINNSPTRE